MNYWESERITKIINAVRKQECLWNVHSEEYGKRDKLEKAWNEVAKEVGKSDVFCRVKWRNVRTGFLRSIQHQIRGSNQKESNDGVKRKQFYLHDQMAFILPSAETLENVRKKRKLNKEHKSTIETDDTDNSNSFTEYSLKRKAEPLEVENAESNDENESEVLEHHTLMINGEVYTDNIDDDEEILKVLNHNKNTTKHESSSSKDNHHQQSSSKYKDDYVIDLITTNRDQSPTTRKVINEKTNDEFDSKTVKSISEPGLKHAAQFSQREEQQLLDFFRSCADDILTLSKRKQRSFKKRMLDVIDELYDA